MPQTPTQANPVQDTLTVISQETETGRPVALLQGAYQSPAAEETTGQGGDVPVWGHVLPGYPFWIESGFEGDRASGMFG